MDQVTAFKYFASEPKYILLDGNTFICATDGQIIDVENVKLIGYAKAQTFLS